MPFPTPMFALFMLALLPLWHGAGARPWARIWIALAAAACVLGASGGPSLAAAACVAGWAAMLARSAGAVGAWPWRVGVAALALPLAYFKYGAWLGLGEAAWRGAMPAGLSFYTFSCLAWVLAKREGSYAGGGLAGAAGALFFPTLGAGPVCRPMDAAEQLAAPLARPEFGRCAAPFVLGLFLKLVVSTRLGAIADWGFANPSSWSLGGMAWTVHAYAGQLYADFAGYSLMAIGVGRALGVELPSNFEAPYFARGIGDFWRRWHVSLSTFWRDRLYIPMGGSRSGRARELAALMAVMLLCGLWHGAGWSFLVWGGLHGAMLCAQRAWRWSGGRRWPGWLAWAATFEFVCWAWLPFRVSDMGQLAVMARSVAEGVGGSGLGVGMDGAQMGGAWILGACWAALFVEHGFKERMLSRAAVLGRGHPWVLCACVVLALMACVELAPEGIPPFIYANF